MRIRAPLFLLELLPASKVDEEDWCTVQVRIETGKITGEFAAWLQTEDLERFAHELAALISNPGRPATATLSSAEHNIEVILEVQGQGRLEGRYVLQPEPPGRTVLSGTFETYDSFMPPLREGVVELLAALRGENAA